ncbi:MAG: DUF937 domain-containing protein [Proteobacteria bacterium]|nr:DUF937 domain-containing protein [Pseudomonadota bacterium]
MGLLDGFAGATGSEVGTELVSVLNGLIEKHGGLQGMVAHLQERGFGTAVRSWIGPGQNLPMSADQVNQAFGINTLTDLAVRAGISPQQLAERVSQLLPQAIDHLTPSGVLPASASHANS